MRRIAILLAVCALALSAAAQQSADKGLSATHLIGLGHVARNAKGTLSIAGDKIECESVDTENVKAMRAPLPTSV